MANRKDTPAATADSTRLVRTSVLVAEDTDRALRQLADQGKRPLSWEIRHALEEYVERQELERGRHRRATDQPAESEQAA